MFQKTLKWYQHLNSGEKIAFWGLLVTIVIGLVTLCIKQSDVQITQSGDQATVVVGDKVEGDKVLGNKIEIHRDENATTDAINISPEELEQALEPFDEKFFGILVAAFMGATEEQNKQGKSLQNTLVATLNARFNELDIKHAEARAIPSSFLPYLKSHTEARKMGKKQKAELVIWGNVTLAGVIPNLTIVNPRAPASLIMDTETQLLKNQLTHKALEDVNEIRLPALTDEPLLIASFTIGIKYYRNSEYDEALRYLARSIPKSPSRYVESGIIFFFIGNCHSAKGEHDQAIVKYDRSIEINPDIPDTYYNRGNMHHFKGNYDQAISDYTNALRLNPEYSSVYNNRGVAYKLKGDLAKAMLDYKMCLKIEPENLNAMTNIGTLYAETGEYELAISFYDKALDMDDKFTLALRNRGKTYIDKGDYDKGISDYNRCIEIDADAKTFNMRGIAYKEIGQYDKAINDYTKATEINPAYTEAYNNLGNLYRDQGNNEQAFPYYEKALELDPNNADIYNNRGMAYANDGDFEHAIRDYTRALEIDSKHAKAHNNLGNVYVQKGEYDKAISCFDQAINRNPRLAIAYNNRGVLYLKKTDYEKAISGFTKAIEIKPDFDKAYCNRGDAYRIQSEYYKISKSKPLLSISPELAAEAYEKRGGVKVDQAIFDQAEFDYKKALEINPDNGDAYWGLAEIYRIQKKDKEAIAMYRRAIELEPKYNMGAFSPGRYYPEFYPDFLDGSERKEPNPKE